MLVGWLNGTRKHIAYVSIRFSATSVVGSVVRDDDGSFLLPV